jgi:hypothetical protein
MDGTVFSRYITMLRPSYAGLGIKYFIDVIKNEGIAVQTFFGTDWGGYYTFGYQSGSNYNNDGTLYYQYNRKFLSNSSLFFGGNIEGGFILSFNSIVGLSINGGYKFGQGFVNYVETSVTGAATINDEYLPVDYSGFYVKIG